MRAVIKQRITLPAPADRLFDMYLDPERHGAFTGHEVNVGPQDGAPLHAFDGQISGYTIAVIKPRVIVQSWRSVNFHDGDPDSTLILTFSEAGNEGQIDLLHVDVLPHELEAVTEGWHTHYWEPWRAYLEG